MFIDLPCISVCACVCLINSFHFYERKPISVHLYITIFIGCLPAAMF